MDKFKFGEYIYNKRKTQGLTQEELGRKIGVTNKAVSKWEVGETCPDISMLAPLSKALGVTIDELLNYTDKEKVETTKNDEHNSKKDQRSSYKEHRENALASGAEEGRDKLRKATCSRK